MTGRTLLIIGGLMLLAIFVLALLRGDNVSETNEAMPTTMPTPIENPEEAEVSTGSTEAGFQLPNATVKVPETDGIEVTLVGGRGEFEDGPVRGTVYMMPDMYAERVTDMGYDLFGVMYVNYGGSGEFAYLALFQYFADATVHQDSAPIGDRVDMNMIGTRDTSNSSAEYEAVADYMMHGPDQAMAEEPSEQVLTIYPVKNHKFVAPAPTATTEQ